MGFATFSGPVRTGTVRFGAAENTGLSTLSRTAYVNVSGVAKISGDSPAAQTLFNLPAGTKILNFVAEVLVTVAGNSVSQVGVTIGKSGSAAEYAASFNTGTAVARVTQAVVDAGLASKAVALDNLGTTDVPVQATFTSTGGNPTSGQIAITVIYQQRADNGAQVPAPSNV